MEVSAHGGTHGGELYFEQVLVRGYIDTYPYRRFTDVFNQKERTYLPLKKGLSQPAQQPPAQQDGQYEVVVPRLAVVCAVPFMEGAPPRTFNAAEYKIVKIAYPCFVAFGAYAALGYIHMREGLEMIDMLEIASDDFLAFTSVNLYFLTHPETPPRSVPLLVVNRHKIEALYLMSLRSERWNAHGTPSARLRLLIWWKRGCNCTMRRSWQRRWATRSPKRGPTTAIPVLSG